MKAWHDSATVSLKKQEMKRKQMGMRFSVLLVLAVAVMSMRSSDPVIKGDMAFLIGDYNFIYSDGGKNLVKQASEYTDKYTLKIKKNDLVLYKNGKKHKKYPFSDVKLDLLEDGTYVMFWKDGEFYPLFYKGDTISIHIFPIEYHDNFYVKQKESN